MLTVLVTGLAIGALYAAAALAYNVMYSTRRCSASPPATCSCSAVSPAPG